MLDYEPFQVSRELKTWNLYNEKYIFIPMNLGCSHFFYTYADKMLYSTSVFDNVPIFSSFSNLIHVVFG